MVLIWILPCERYSHIMTLWITYLIEGVQMTKQQGSSLLSFLWLVVKGFLSVLVFFLDLSTSNDSRSTKHVSFDDNLSDDKYYDNLGKEYERGLDGKLRNNVEQKKEKFDPHLW